MVSKIKPQQNNNNNNNNNKKKQQKSKQTQKIKQKKEQEEILKFKNNTLGAFSVLEDQFILNEILSEFSCEELIKYQGISAGFYILCNDDRLWKDAFFKQIKDRKEQVKYIQNWKISAISFLYPNNFQYTSPYIQLSFPKFQSHEIYTRWLRRHMSVRNYGFDLGHVKHIDSNSLTVEEFIRDFETPNIPVIFKGAQDGTGCMNGEWTTEKLIEKYGDTIFKIAHQDNKRIQMTFRDYVQYMKTQNDEEPLYVFDQAFGEKAPSLLEQYKVPKYFPEDLFQYSGPEERPHFRWLVIGPERSGASWHIDPAGTSAWNSLISGKKRWLMYPPAFTPYTVDLEDFEEKIYGSPPSLLWLLEVYPYLPPDYRPIECIQEPGETIFVPGGWWHMVLNLEESIAVTQNFCDSQNFTQVCQDLSGTEHDRKDYDQFKQHLLREKPEFTEKFKEFEFKNNQFVHSFDDEKYWNPIVIKLLKYNKLIDQDIQESSLDIQMPTSGQSPVFIVDNKFVVKFYCSELSGGEKSWSNEIYVYLKIKENEILHSRFPKLLSSGKINQVLETPVNEDEWKWPYIVTEFLQDKLNLQDVQEVPEALPYPYNFPSPDDDENDDEDDDEEEDTLIAEEKLIEFLNQTVYQLHSIDIDQSNADSNQNIKDFYSSGSDKWLPWKKYLKEIEKKYIYNHWNWNGLPVHIRSQMESYLPNDIYQLIDTTLEPCFIHGDLTDENVLGIEKSTVILNKQPQPPTNKIKNSKKIQFQNKIKPSNTKTVNIWEPTHLIDLGDSQIGDRWYELVSLHISLFAGNKTRLRSFLENYKLKFIDGSSKSWLEYYNQNPESFIKRAMSYTLIHHCDAITTITRHYPNYRNAQNINELSKLIWEL
ncbi:hypothetical protein DICPUDRAFT_155396 [Dictyostelium purpureum]|uniref:JmjC domain-containing protein n=1 Tax=Dictyostelium purpureum TaxID=5786 RepID=F0ZTW3_DICPU|nr:uncharacterized protein DICPUDRAFT_155396 [Dictyostelium purpureum]EGC32612.1 hypothetical protein DICPUDRAFT_155396 [Dictyostelium purpureum]|eukprot:XP_003290864.1 hypothetical protein DICPUDRAFT_155396 [Dictyostelium purpureum]